MYQKKYSYYKLKDGSDYVRFVLENVNGSWMLAAFDCGKIGKTRYRTDGGNIMFYRKDGPGRESIYVKKEWKSFIK